MRRIALLVCLAAAAVSAFAQKRVTVNELEQRVNADRGRSDGDLAQKLENLELTQRLSGTRLKTLEAELPGSESRGALLAVADLAEVLDLPPEEVPKDPAPTAEEQQQMLTRAHATPSTSDGPPPNFDATAEISHFRNLKYLWSQNLSYSPSPSMPIVVPTVLLESRGTEEVAYRNGRVLINETKKAHVPGDSVTLGAEDWNGLYALLGNVLTDMRTVKPEWAGWEPGTLGKLAVFRFKVDEDHSHVEVRTLMKPNGRLGFEGHPGYGAEVALDPATGAVLRFVVRAALGSHQSVSRADVAAEFGPVQIDGKRLDCPTRTVTIGESKSFVSYYNLDREDFETVGSLDTREMMHVVDVEFTNYRLGAMNTAAAGDSAFVTDAMKVTQKRVTVDELEKIVAGLGGDSDHDAAEKLAQIELSQRLTAKRYANLRAQLKGKASDDALLALYDLSEFSDLPKVDMAAEAAPDVATQGKILTSAVEFVAKISHKMPDLFATRQLTRFEDLEVVRGAPTPLLAQVKPLALVDESTGTVHFRDGKEVVETSTNNAHGGKNAHWGSFRLGLDTWGVFGPLLESVMADVLHSRIGWGHWEDGPNGRLAVFRYAVAAKASHYSVRFCCYLAKDGDQASFAATPGYHGELFIDPKTGEVLRLVLKADFESNAAQQSDREASPLLRNDVLVDYGAVDIGGKQYICPVRDVSVMTTWTLGPEGPLRKAMTEQESKRLAKKALAEMEFSRANAINEAAFSDYHVFRSETRILTGPVQPVPETPKQ